MKIETMIPESWRGPLAKTLAKPWVAELETFVAKEYETATVFPPQDQIFAALDATPFDKVRVVIIGQDPYHGAGQGHGLCFSVQPDVTIPPSLRNIYKELEADLGIKPPNHGYLMSWAHQGILLLNAVLTVREADAGSHRKKGWEKLTDAMIKAVAAADQHVVFVLWGGFAKKKAKFLDRERHTIIESGHPSPLSIKYFRDTKPFSKVNAALESKGQKPIDWSVPVQP